VIDAATAAWAPLPELEVTLEANPSSVEAARFADLAVAGVNRVSLGLQALDDAALHFLGRAHDVAEALGALDVAQRHFARVSTDLIYARPDQSLAAWERELAQALGFGTEHLSLYQLTIEPGTRFHTEAAAGRLTIPDGDAAADLFEATRAITAAAGLPAYEVSNHARPGAESRHNLAYWRYRDYAGVGPGAHGRRQASATQRHRKPENWLGAVARNGHGLVTEEPLAPEARAREALLMGLRLAEGVDLARVARVTGLAVEAIVDDDAIASLPGLIAHDGERLRVTEAGILLLDSILPRVVR
jgi:putative oxygen-independent coproporphyrinogen III oxidase